MLSWLKKCNGILKESKFLKNSSRSSYLLLHICFVILGKGPRSPKFVNPNLVHDEEHGSPCIMDNPHVPCMGLLPSRPVHVLHNIQIPSKFHLFEKHRISDILFLTYLLAAGVCIFIFERYIFRGRFRPHPAQNPTFLNFIWILILILFW